MPRRIEIDCEELRTGYQAGLTIVILARHYHCSPGTIAKRLHMCGVTMRDARFRPVVVPEARLRELYLDKRLPLIEIAEQFGVAVSTIGNKRRLYNIPVRPRRPNGLDPSGEP